MDNKRVGISKDINRVFLIVFLAGLTLGIYIPAASANTIKQFNVEEGDAFWYDLTVNASETVDVSVWTDGAPDNNDILITSFYDSIGNQMNAGTGNHGKTTFGLGFSPTITSTFRVRVYLYDVDRVRARTITVSSPQFISTAPHYMETANNIAEGDTFWYYLTVNSTGIVGINAWTDGGLDYDRFELYLFDPTGKEVSTTSGSNKASITYIAKTTGVFKVQVHINKIRGGTPHKITVSSNYPFGVNPPASPTPQVLLENGAEQKTFTNPIGMEFVQIPAGEFKMGSPLGEVGRWYTEGPIHTVKITKSFYISKYEVTQKQWRDVMGDNPSRFKGDNLPVEKVSWNDIQKFIKKLNEKEGGDYYRLPSEAEWEYAARAGTTIRYFFGDDESRLGEYAWYYNNSDGKTHEVGQKKPNPWGLYDIYGNVKEWVQDNWHNRYIGAPSDGSAWVGDNFFHASRGCGWGDIEDGCRSANRNGIDAAGLSFDFLGFRLVSEPPPQEVQNEILTLSPTPTNTPILNSIVIDGNPQDWAGIKPIMTDPEGDSKNVQGSDLKSLYALNDNEFLYLMLEVYDNPNGSKEKVQYVFEIANNTDSPFLKLDYEIGAEAQGNPWLWNLTEYDTRINDKDPNPYGLVRGVPGVEALGKDVFEMKIPLHIIGNPKNMIIRARTQPPSGHGFYDDMPAAKYITNPSLVIPEKQTPTLTFTPTHGEELKNENQLSEGLKYFAFPALASLAMLGIVLFLEKREKNKRRFKDDLRTRHWLGYYSTLICYFIVGAIFVIVSFSVFIKELPVSFDAGKFFFTIPLFYLSVSSFILTIGLLRLKPVKKLNILHFIISLLMGVFLIFVALTDPKKSPPVIFPILVLLSSVMSVWYDRIAIFRPEYAQESSIQKGETKSIPEPEIRRGYVILSNNDIKFGIKVTNNTGYTITDVDAILDYNEGLFNLKESKILRIGNIPPDTARTAAYILKPLGCIHKEQINALITYKDYTGKKRKLDMHPKEVHCICPFLKEKPMGEGEYSRLAANSEFMQEGISFKGISIGDLAKFMGETCRHMLYKVKEYDIEGKKVIYLSGESLGEKALYLMTVVIQEYNGLTQVFLRAHSDKRYGLSGFLNEIADSIRHLVSSVQSAKEIGIIENTQVINIIDSVVQRTSFDLGAGGNTLVNIKDSVVQRTVIKGDEEKLEEKLRKGKEVQAGDAKAPEYEERMESQEEKATPFEGIWSRIVVNSGELFHTKTGLEFTYKIEGDRFYPSRTDYAISKNDFRTAYELVPIDGPGVINDNVRGPAYVWAVLHDQRISKGEW